MTKSRGIYRPKTKWSADQDALLRELYPVELAAEIATRLGVSLSQIYSRANKLGLSKSSAFYKSLQSARLDGIKGASTRFQAGAAPWNKGIKGVCHAGSVATQFKPGHLGGSALQKIKPIGYTRIVNGYQYTKVNDELPFYKRWKATHHLIWERLTGRSIPKGYLLTFRDGDSLNFAYDNFDLISREVNMQRHTYHQYGPDIAKVVQLKGAITKQINKRIKSQEAV